MRKLIAMMIATLMMAASPALSDQSRVIAGIGAQESVGSAEFSLRYVAPEPMLWRLHPAFGASLAGNGSGWAGIGSALTFGQNEGIFLRITNMVGAYRRGSGRDLGGALQFRNALDIGYRWHNGIEAGLGADHRSNAGLSNPNPGLNTIYLFTSMPLN